MTRRDLMAVTARCLAAAGGQEFFTHWMSAAEAGRHAHSSAPPEPDRWSRYQPKFFSSAEFAMLESFTEILLPTDETPGAREAHVAHYIDFVVNAAGEFAPELQTDWRTAVNWLAGQRFGELTPQQKVALIEQSAAPERDRSTRHDGFVTYRLIKQMTLFAFYTSRAGLIQNLDYQGLAYLTAFPACNHAEHRKV